MTISTRQTMPLPVGRRSRRPLIPNSRKQRRHMQPSSASLEQPANRDLVVCFAIEALASTSRTPSTGFDRPLSANVN
jgi:hypothetical protein